MHFRPPLPQLIGSIGSLESTVYPDTSIRGAGLQNAIAAGTAPVLAAASSVEASLAAVFIPGSDEIESIEVDGRVEVSTATTSGWSGRTYAGVGK